MRTLRMDHVSVVVRDLEATIAFFVELGMEVEGTTPVEGPLVDRLCGLDGVRVEMAMLRTPDGHGRLELTEFLAPDAIEGGPQRAPANVLGLRSVMFAVDDIEDAVARLGAHGATLIGDIVRYEGAYLLCYLRGPGDVIVALAEEIG